LCLWVLIHVGLTHGACAADVLQCGTEVMDVTTALEAACCCMQVLAAADMHSSLYLDEVVTGVIQLAKFQLQKNVLALHDPQYMRLYRPSAAAAGAGGLGVIQPVVERLPGTAPHGKQCGVHVVVREHVSTGPQQLQIY